MADNIANITIAVCYQMIVQFYACRITIKLTLIHFYILSFTVAMTNSYFTTAHDAPLRLI